jgi:hypothetical protein
MPARRAEKLNNPLNRQNVLGTLDGYNLGTGFDLDQPTGSKHQKIAQLFEQKFTLIFSMFTYLV